MFSKGRKLVNLVKQNDQKREVSSCDADNRTRSTSNKIPSQTPARRKATEKSKNASERDTDWILDENKVAAILMAESSQINEATVLVDESRNSTTSEQSKILTRHVIIPESPVSTSNTSIISELSSESILEASSTSADKITTASEYLTETTNRILTPHFDSNRSTPVNNLSKYFTDLDSGSNIEDSSHALNGEHPTLPVAIKTVTDLLVGTIESECIDFLDDSCSVFLDLNSIQKSPTSTNAHFTNDEFQSLQSISKQDAAEILRNDLCMSDEIKKLKIKWLRLWKESPSSIFYKYDLQDPEFMKINLCKTRSAKKKQECIHILRSPLKKAYESEMHVSQAKKKDLITLLKDGVIPPEYANYYNNIPSAAEIIHVFTDSEKSDDDE